MVMVTTGRVKQDCNATLSKREPVPCVFADSFNVFKTTKEAVSIVNLFTPKTAQAPFFLLFSLRFRRKCVYLQR